MFTHFKYGIEYNYTKMSLTIQQVLCNLSDYISSVSIFTTFLQTANIWALNLLLHLFTK